MVKSLRIRYKVKKSNNASSITVGGTKRDAFGIGTSGTGNIFGKEVDYTVNGNVINYHGDNLSNEVVENLKKILSVQTELLTTIAAKEDYKKDVTKLEELKETQKKITNVLDDVKQIEMKEGTHIREIKAGDFQISRDDLFVKDFLTKGNELFYQDKYPEALDWYEKAIATDPNDADAWFNKGLTLHNLGKYQEEIKSLDRAIEIKPDYVGAWNNKGLTLEELGKYDEAIKAYDKAIEINPDYSLAKQNRDIVLKKSKKKKGWFR